MTKNSLGNDIPEGWGEHTPGEPFPTEAWVFTPASSITAKELAEIMASFQMALPPDHFENLIPAHLRRHFKFKSFQ